MPKDKIVFVRLSKSQSKAIDQIVRDENRRPSSVGKFTRSDAIRLAVSDYLDKHKPKDMDLLINILPEEEIDRVGDQ